MFDRDAKEDVISVLPISRVVPNREQPRQHFDEDKLSELADSIKRHGLIEPIIVEKSGMYYKIIAGERRWRASRIAGVKEIPVILKKLSKREKDEIALVENIQREDLNPMEEALAYKSFCEAHGVSHQELADIMSVSRVAVTNTMRLLQLPESVQKYVLEGKLSKGHAKIIAGLKNADTQTEVAEAIISSGMNVRQTEAMIRSIATKKRKKKAVKKDSNLEYASTKLSEILGTKVSIEKKKESGEIRIEFYSNEDLDNFYEYLLGYRE